MNDPYKRRWKVASFFEKSGRHFIQMCDSDDARDKKYVNLPVNIQGLPTHEDAVSHANDMLQAEDRGLFLDEWLDAIDQFGYPPILISGSHST